MRPDGRRVCVFRTKDGEGIKAEIYEGENGGRILFSWRRSSEHKFRKWKAWGIDVEIIDRIFRLFPAVADQPQNFVIYDEDEKIYYQVDKRTFMSESQLYTPPENTKNSDGPQYMLPLRRWETTTLLQAQVASELRKNKQQEIKKNRKGTLEKWI